jgi:malonyl-CoA/methylmalonyl-CoA synthetase
MNPLADALITPLEHRQTPVLIHADGREITGVDLFCLCGQIANVLVKAGVAPGDRVAMQAEKTVEALALYLACLRVGALFLPLNTAYTAPEIAYFLEDAQPRVAVVAPISVDKLRPLAAAHGTELLTLDAQGHGTLTDRASQAPVPFENVARKADDLAAILYTSGTTGRSKGAMLSHNNLLSNAKTLVKAWRFSEHDTLLHALPIFHVHGLFVAMNITLLAGGKAIFLPKFDLDVMIEKMPQATSLMGVPTFYTRLLSDARFTKELTRHMRLFISGSAPLLAETHREFETRTDHRILERYGMTETTMSTSNPYEGERRAGTVGPVLPGIEARIVDGQSGETLPQGEIGVLEVRGDNVFQGYWRMPEKTAEEFREDGFFITGDIAQISEDGYVTIVGRAKDLVISGGYNIYPKEVEGEIDALSGVLESAVIGVPHPDFGEAVVAVVVKDGSAEITAGGIIAALQERLAKFKCPKLVSFAGELPRNTMGKVQKAELRKEFADSFTP